MKTVVLIIITVICVWALAPYFPSPADFFTAIPKNEEPPMKEIKPRAIITLEDIEGQVFELINEQRKTEGLSILSLDRNLQKQAREHSELMATSENFEHSSLDVFENCYWGINISPERLAQSIFDTWVGSKGHLENMLEISINSGAIGIAENKTKRSVFATFMAK